MNYGAMKTLFNGLLNRRDNTAALTETFMQNSLLRTQRKLRIPAMEASTVFTIPSNYTGLQIPNDFLELIALSDPANATELTRTSLQNAMRYALILGELPRVFARQAGKWVIGPTPTTATTIQIDYYALFGTLAADGDTNVITDVMPDGIVYGALSLACDYYLDKRHDVFEQRYLSIRDGVQEQADMDELSGISQVAACNSYPVEEDCG
jgi:hypothetical protein